MGADDVPERGRTWWATVRLALCASVLSGLVAATFAGRIADRVLICGIILVASMVGWTHAEQPPAVVRAPVRRR